MSDQWYETADFRNGLKVELDGNPYTITYFQFVKPGKGTAFTRTKMKNMLSGATIERTFRTGETLKAADIEELVLNYSYDDGQFYVFMHPETYEQYPVDKKSVEQADFLTENLECSVMFYKGKAVNVELPYFIESEITYTEPGQKGNTATGATKPATLACGATVNVPLFVEQGQVIQVDTRTRDYVKRVR